MAGTPEHGAACTPEAGGDGMCALGVCVPEGCGDGTRQDPEECDDGGESANCNADCTFAMCGDGKLNASAEELCDGDDLDGLTCSQIVGFTGGTLHCNTDCNGYDTSSCTAPTGGAPGDACTKDDQ